MQIDDDMILESLTVLPYPEYFVKKAVGLIKDELEIPVILSLDISNFKYFNEMYGFAEGDMLIKRCVDWFCHNNPDCILAHRTYVDHLVLLLDATYMTKEELWERYNKLNTEFSDMINRQYPLARIRIYVGAYYVEDREESITTMMDKAQYARRSIKQDYEKNIAFYTQEMQIRTKAEASVIPMFMSALENDRISIYLQPKFSIDEQKLIGAEALSRIIDEDGNVIPPGMYIDVLEKSGLINKLDEYVVSKVIDMQKQWQREGRELIRISMNLSKIDFWEPGFIESLDRKIADADISPEYFEFELTETVFCEKVSDITRQIEFLRRRGYTISMDDFGSGYNSLHMLGRIPVDIIKFDRGFVLNCIPVEEGRKIMRSLVNTFQEINFSVICEGIESAEEEKIVFECGCNAVQGYYHDKPLPSGIFADKYL